MIAGWAAFSLTAASAGLNYRLKLGTAFSHFQGGTTMFNARFLSTWFRFTVVFQSLRRYSASARTKVLTCVLLAATFAPLGAFLGERAFAIPAPTYVCCPSWPTNPCPNCWLLQPALGTFCYDGNFDGYSVCQSGGSYSTTCYNLSQFYCNGTIYTRNCAGFVGGRCGLGPYTACSSSAYPCYSTQ